MDCNGHEYDLPEGQISGAIVGDNGVVMLRMNEYLSAEDDGLPLEEHLSETYSPWYTIKLNYIAPDDYTVPADQVQNLTPAEGTPQGRGRDAAHELRTVCGLDGRRRTRHEAAFQPV